MTDNLKKWVNGARTTIRNMFIGLGVTVMLWTMIPGTAFADPTIPPKADLGNITDAPSSVQAPSIALRGTVLVVGLTLGFFLLVKGIGMLARSKVGGGTMIACAILLLLFSIFPSEMIGLVLNFVMSFAPKN